MTITEFIQFAQEVVEKAISDAQTKGIYTKRAIEEGGIYQTNVICQCE